MRRLMVLSVLAALVSVPAAAQTWQEYAYPDAGFAASFPAPPQITNAPYAMADGKSVNQQSYSVAQPARLYRVTVTDFSDQAIEADDAINQAAERLHGQGDVSFDMPA